MKREFKLFDEVLSVSHAYSWEEARQEWSLEQLYRDISDETNCACGKESIHNICVIHNAITANSLVVGNCCVNKFLLLPSQRIFAAYKRLVQAQDLTSAQRGSNCLRGAAAVAARARSEFLPRGASPARYIIGEARRMAGAPQRARAQGMGPEQSPA